MTEIAAVFLIATALLVVGAFLTFTLEGKRVNEESPFSKEDAAMIYEEPY